jgi:putative oxidoreductase
LFGHGAQKMLGWYGGQGLASSMRTFSEHLHLPSILAFLVIAGEFFSGIGLIVGLFSRIAALVIVLTIDRGHCNGSFSIRPLFGLVRKPEGTWD